MKPNVQMDRIKEKLKAAKSLDKELEVFGARSHKYFVGKPASNKEIDEFETDYHIRLPESFKSFLTEIGNGGIEYQNSVVGNSAAGPNYGIYKLGNHMDVLVDSSSGYLQKEVVFDSGLNESGWIELCKNPDKNHTAEEFEKFKEKIYAGILIIGFCGCSGYQGIVLNGPERGRIVYVYDEVEYMPHFSKELTFPDWYENWLNDIIDNRKPGIVPAKKQ